MRSIDTDMRVTVREDNTATITLHYIRPEQDMAAEQSDVVTAAATPSES